MSDLPIKNSALRYINPADGNVCFVFAHEQITDLEDLASKALPQGCEYTVVSWGDAHAEINQREEPAFEVEMPNVPKRQHESTLVSQMGYFGNIWVRQNILENAGDESQGHKHAFDHVSMLVSGKVKVEVEGFEPTEFTAPTFIIIKKEHRHKFTALEDGSIWFCVFALRDVDGEVTDIYSGNNSPYGRVSVGDMAALEATSQENHS